MSDMSVPYCKRVQSDHTRHASVSQTLSYGILMCLKRSSSVPWKMIQYHSELLKKVFVSQFLQHCIMLFNRFAITLNSYKEKNKL